MIPLSVFIVHADASVGARLAGLIAGAGHAPVLLGSGERAIDRFVQEPADVIIVDYFLPGRDGVATIESIRWAPGGRQVHVVLLSLDETMPPLRVLGDRIGAIATILGDPTEDAIAKALASIADRSPDEVTRIARPEEIQSALDQLADGHADQSEPVSDTVLAHRGEDDVRARSERPSVDAEAAEEGRVVGVVTRGPTIGSPEIHGHFRDTAFPRLLRQLADLRTSGALVCVAKSSHQKTTTGDPPAKIIYFRSGVPVHVRSNLLDECLGQMLVRRRRIGIATLEESIRRMQLGEGWQGQILIDMGALAPLELGDALAQQARDKLFDVFGWTTGTYHLRSDLESPVEAVGIELGLPEIIYEGVCAAMPASRLMGLLAPSLDRFVVPVPTQIARFVRVRWVPEARQVLAKIDGTLTLREVLTMGSRPTAVAQLAYAMECLGAVRFSLVPAPSARNDMTDRERSPTDDRHSSATWNDRTIEDDAVPAPAMLSSATESMSEAADQEDDRVAPRSDVTETSFDPRAGRLFEAEREFRRGNLALDRDDFTDALSAFVRAFELCPDQGEFLAHVGFTRHRAAGDDPAVSAHALAELSYARTLAPESIITHLFHGRVLRAVGNHDAAEEAFQAVLQLDPIHEEALDALESLRNEAGPSEYPG